jgi:hypothetical protein
MRSNQLLIHTELKINEFWKRLSPKSRTSAAIERNEYWVHLAAIARTEGYSDFAAPLERAEVQYEELRRMEREPWKAEQ